ncbi:MAG: hypothetical protein ABI175_04595, partial [Polyangiales bacterium]
MGATELADVDAHSALAFAREHLAPLWQSTNPFVRRLAGESFHRDWQVEAGRWLKLAEAHGYLRDVLAKVLGAANAPIDAENTHRDRLFRSFLAWFAEPMAAYFFVRTGWGFGEWNPRRFRPAHDIDFILGAPVAHPIEVLVQVKSPDAPGQLDEDGSKRPFGIRAGRPARGKRSQYDNDEFVWKAIEKGLKQLPSAADMP